MVTQSSEREVPSRENGSMFKNEGESMGNELHHMNDVSPDPVRRL
jgi:hypothetical protein